MRLSLPSLRRPSLSSVGLINAALAVAAVGGGFWAYQIVSGPAQAQASQSTTRTRVVAVTQGTVSQTVTASGSVASSATANANFTTSGTVTEVGVKVGDVVTKGQVLAKVDPTAANASLSTAKANLTAAKAALTRADNNNADDATIASAEAQVATAQANVTSAQTTVNGTVLAAPIAGTVTAVNGAVGSASSSSGGSGTGSSSTSSTSSTGFIQLADLTKLQINAGFAEADATKLKAGQTAEISWSALSGTRATGKVSTISPTATTTNNVNSYAVVIGLDTLPEGVRLGQSTSAVVTIAEAQNAVRIPTQALRTAGGQRTVQVQVNGQVETRTVEVGITGGSFVEIKSGLTAGEQVVITTTTTNSTTGTNTGQFPGGGGGFTGGGGGFTGGGGGARPGN